MPTYTNGSFTFPFNKMHVFKKGFHFLGTYITFINLCLCWHLAVCFYTISWLYYSIAEIRSPSCMAISWSYARSDFWCNIFSITSAWLSTGLSAWLPAQLSAQSSPGYLMLPNLTNQAIKLSDGDLQCEWNSDIL